MHRELWPDLVDAMTTLAHELTQTPESILPLGALAALSVGTACDQEEAREGSRRRTAAERSRSGGHPGCDPPRGTCRAMDAGLAPTIATHLRFAKLVLPRSSHSQCDRCPRAERSGRSSPKESRLDYAADRS
jgi:hypothetical protein